MPAKRSSPYSTKISSAPGGGDALIIARQPQTAAPAPAAPCGGQNNEVVEPPPEQHSGQASIVETQAKGKAAGPGRSRRLVAIGLLAALGVTGPLLIHRATV